MGGRGRDAAIPPRWQGHPGGSPIGRQPVRVVDRMPEGLLSRRSREHRERRHRRSLLTGGADAHVPTLGGRDHQDRGGIEALLAEIPRKGRGRGGTLPFPDLGDVQGETVVRPGCLGTGVLMRAASHVQGDPPSSSSGAVALRSVVRNSRDRPHARPGAAAARRYRPLHTSRPSPAGPQGQQHGCWQDAAVTGCAPAQAGRRYRPGPMARLTRVRRPLPERDTRGPSA